MEKKVIALAAVAPGYELKQLIRRALEERGHAVIDLGCDGKDHPVTYTSAGERLAHALQEGRAGLGVFCCDYGSSSCTGVAKFRGVSAFACESERTAEMCRKVNGVNVLCLGKSVVSPEAALGIVRTFIGSEFLDLEMPEKVRRFRERARDEVTARGDLARACALETM